MNRWLSNISVNLKLSLGFGLVLALTCVMAVCNWISLDKMIDRSNWMSDITRLNTAFTNLRVTRLQYMLTDGDETAAQNVQASIDAFSAQQNQLIATFQSPENLKLLKEQQEIIGRYERAGDHAQGVCRVRRIAGQHGPQCRPGPGRHHHLAQPRPATARR